MSRASEEHIAWMQQLEEEGQDQRPWQEQINELMEIETKQEEDISCQ